jgi:hypothetical protein
MKTILTPEAIRRRGRLDVMQESVLVSVIAAAAR